MGKRAGHPYVRFMLLEVRPERPRLVRALLPLGLVFLSVGVSTALVGPFLSLFLTTEVETSTLQVTAFLVAAPLSGVIVATLLGRLSDRRPIRRRLLIVAGAAGTLGCLVTAVVRDYWVLLALTVTATAVATSLFSQAFAYARQLLQRDAPQRSALAMSALRTVFSLAWVAGPAAAAFILDAGGFVWVYGLAALMYACATLVAIFLLEDLDAAGPRSKTSEKPAPALRRHLLIAALAFTMLQVPSTLGVQLLPLFITGSLGGEVSQAGWVLGLCALLEIPMMLGLGALSTRVPVRLLLFGGALCGAAYYALSATATSVWVLVAGQLLNALFISAVSGLGITFMQDLLPDHPGQATAYFSNAFPLGSMLAGPLFGLARENGYRLAYTICVVLCVVGLLILLLVRAGRVREST
jgi:MFS transporter, SET family, sugar efflux transporter